MCGDEILSIRHTGASRRQKQSSNYKNSQVVYGDRGDLAEFGKKKRNTDYDFPPPLYVGGK